MRWDAILAGKWEVPANFTVTSYTVAAIPVKTRMHLMHNASKSSNKKFKVKTFALLLVDLPVPDHPLVSYIAL